MAISNLIAVAIIFTTAATLHKAGVTGISSSTEAAKALEPVAGKFAFVVFSAGIIGTGLLAVPVLAGSAAFAVGEAMRWPVGLEREPKEAVAFYATLVAATVLGTGIMFTPIDPIKALYWSAVINGICAVPVMVVMMLMAGRKEIMGKFPVQGWLRYDPPDHDWINVVIASHDADQLRCLCPPAGKHQWMLAHCLQRPIRGEEEGRIEDRLPHSGMMICRTHLTLIAIKTMVSQWREPVSLRLREGRAISVALAIYSGVSKRFAGALSGLAIPADEDNRL